ncbi:hypothetical protein OG864_49770 [Streptomyces sp. NBC_00124]|uniref:hypothetical protein n=1 Tax=Streptomyces sp. NBC_00124 TaxID=2975662 RepID=UPI002253AB32|nr:hypothetical protein [Streptomyces sp. NBC_00124]MCX5366786.1 hypothetical protein [Streptomyces sp. NBC_00124]
MVGSYHRDEILDLLEAREANTGRQAVHALANEIVTGQGDGNHGKRVELQTTVRTAHRGR